LEEKIYIMKKNLDLFDILQNPTIGVIAIQSFILGYTKITVGRNEKEVDPSINYLFYVLPIVYGTSSLNSFKSSRELYTAISKDKTITLGLQQNANKMSLQTFDSLNLGFSKGIFLLNKENLTIGLAREYSEKSILNAMKISDQYYRDLRKASFQLGNVFAKKDKKMLQITLNIRF